MTMGVWLVIGCCLLQRFFNHCARNLSSARRTDWDGMVAIVSWVVSIVRSGWQLESASIRAAEG